MKKTFLKNTIFIVLAWLFTISFRKCIAVDEYLSYTNSIISFIVFAVYLYSIFKITQADVWKSEIKGYLGSGLLFSVLFFGAMISGVQLDLYGKVDFADISNYVSLTVLSIGGAPLIAWMIHKLGNKTKEYDGKAAVVNKKFYLKVYLLFLVAYLIVLLAVWPGFFLYDAEVETYMVFTDKYSAHHPMAHVLLLGWIMKVMYKIIPSYNVGIATYLIIQMMVVSACFTYMIAFMKKIGIRKWIINGSIVFLALFPTVSMFVCCSTKDVYFSAGVVLFTTLLLELAREGKNFWNAKRKSILLILAILLIVLFRNNGLYALIAAIPVLIIVYRKYWKSWLKVLITVVAVYCVFNISVNAIFNVKPGEKAEMLCVPMQQLARAHQEAKDCFTEEDLEVMYELIPEVILEKYNPKLADNVKVNFLEDNFKADPGKFIKLWIRIGMRRPDIYINSFLMNTYGYWYSDTIIDGYTGKWIVNREYEDSSYFAYETERPGISKPLIPFLAKFYEKISLEIYQQKVPVVSMLFSMGFWLWTYSFMVMYLLKTGHKKQALAFLPIGFIYLTVILGPIAIVRYVLYFYFCAPLVLALLFDTKAFKNEN